MLPERRHFLKTLATTWVASSLWGRALRAAATVTLPFENGIRDLVQYPGKRKLIRLTSRPPQLETPFQNFNEGLVTPNDAFFVRYHLSGLPTEIDVQKFRLEVRGKVQNPLSLTLAALKSQFKSFEICAVNQCSGNGRGFSNPRVGGGQLANGAMGNAVWKGVRLADVLKKAGLDSKATHVSFDGLDRPLMPATPDFVKALTVEHANRPEVLLAYQMNGQDLPYLNGFPLRLVVPGYFGTYWVKHLNQIEVLDHEFDGFWMKTAYRIPEAPGSERTKPIGKMVIRSFLTSHLDQAEISVEKKTRLRGIAFDGGTGIREVRISTDQGKSWTKTSLGKDLGPFSFREWTCETTFSEKGEKEIWVRAESMASEIQPLETVFNKSGYQRNGVEKTKVKIV
ncbi:MAG: molybdopterin-dependent oxidoreductase [Bdellovibrionales bacterium]|nr:molybdopterin-dependent oxidoreductase [Bdellovibrionales bacterium]